MPRTRWRILPLRAARTRVTRHGKIAVKVEDSDRGALVILSADQARALAKTLTSEAQAAELYLTRASL